MSEEPTYTLAQALSALDTLTAEVDALLAVVAADIHVEGTPTPFYSPEPMIQPDPMRRRFARAFVERALFTPEIVLRLGYPTTDESEDR
jgi:hypothetical protein